MPICSDMPSHQRVVPRQRILWSGCVVAAILASGCSDDSQPIPRGTKHAVPEDMQTLKHNESAPVKNAQPTVVNEQAPEPADPNNIITDAVPEHVRTAPLDLSLPELSWSREEELWPAETQEPLRQSIARAFDHPSLEQPVGVEWSGKLLWDESEEAEDKPLQEAFNGAELEIRIRLP